MDILYPNPHDSARCDLSLGTKLKNIFIPYKSIMVHFAFFFAFLRDFFDFLRFFSVFQVLFRCVIPSIVCVFFLLFMYFLRPNPIKKRMTLRTIVAIVGALSSQRPQEAYTLTSPFLREIGFLRSSKMSAMLHGNSSQTCKMEIEKAK